MERKENSNYREYYTDLTAKVKQQMGTSLGTIMYHQRLKLGDFALIFDEKAEQDVIEEPQTGRRRPKSGWASDFVMERKALQDIVSRSAGSHTRSGSGPHWTQERRLRHCGLRFPCFLIEGDRSRVNQTNGPIFQHSDHSENPDVITSSDDLRNYMAGVLARNYAENHEVFLFNPLNPGYARLTITGMCLVTLCSVLNKRVLGETMDGMSLDEFEKYCGKWGADKKGREAEMKEKLMELDVEREVVDRINRRFGDWDGLLQAYSLCEDDDCRRYLLADLGVGGTNLNRVACSSIYQDQVGENDNLSEDLKKLMASSSATVWSLCLKMAQQQDSGVSDVSSLGRKLCQISITP